MAHAVGAGFGGSEAINEAFPPDANEGPDDDFMWWKPGDG